MSQQQPQAPSQPATPVRAESADPSIRYVGLDVHKQQITYCILDGSGAVLQQGEIVLTRDLLAKLAATKLKLTDHVALIRFIGDCARTRRPLLS